MTATALESMCIALSADYGNTVADFPDMQSLVNVQPLLTCKASKMVYSGFIVQLEGAAKALSPPSVPLPLMSLKTAPATDCTP